MAENDRPLPDPPRSRFRRQVRAEGEGAVPLTADRLAQAAAEGCLEEVLQREIPEGEHARSLAMMMLGMSGMMPPEMPATLPGVPAGTSGTAAAVPVGPEACAAPGVAAVDVPPEVLAATMQGDVAGLMSLLRAEHEKRGDAFAREGHLPHGAPSAPAAAAAPQTAAGESAGAARAGIDKALVDELIRIAADNQVTVDWLLLRAVKLYLEEHRRTGRL